jgi:cyclic beta-1,2-glucan synthetase
MRGEIFSADHLESHAAALAAQQGGAKARRRGFPLLRRVRENGAALHTAHRAITRTAQSQRGLTPAAEWLADNFHVVDEQLREIRNHLPRDYYLELPKLAQGAFRDYPRVYAVICAYIAHTDSRLDAEILGRFVRAYQTVQPLTTGELWAVAITLRIALIENLRRLADLVVGGRDARIKADRVADYILGLRTAAVTEEAAPRDWERFGDSPYFDAFAVQIFQRIQDQTTPSSPALDWLDGELQRRGLSSQEIIRLEHQKQAALNVSVRNIITSMRLVLELDWKEFFETASHVEAILRASPGYKDMDFDSRDLYRHAVEDLARGSGLSESEIANRAVKAIEEHAPDSTGEAGYHLIGPGRADFQKRIRYRWRYREYAGMLIKRNAL